MKVSVKASVACSVLSLAVATGCRKEAPPPAPPPAAPTPGEVSAATLRKVVDTSAAGVARLGSASLPPFEQCARQAVEACAAQLVDPAAQAARDPSVCASHADEGRRRQCTAAVVRGVAHEKGG
ncbi:MAG: hypothetical protein FJ087_11865, partial [Deltaproteobacteria bacterium]|nr:hypothetical protein [Deltaproteobacteria bacterium]